MTAHGLVVRVVLPSPIEVARQFPAVIRSSDFYRDLSTTLYEIAAAFGIASVIAVGTGYFISRAPIRVLAYEPILSALFATSLILFYPIFVLIFGLGPASKIAIASLIAFFPIVLATIAGFHSVERIHIIAARTMGASSIKMLRWVMLPSALPVIVTGLRIGLVAPPLSVFGSETLGSRSGLGFNVIALTENMEAAKTYL